MCRSSWHRITNESDISVMTELANHVPTIMESWWPFQLALSHINGLHARHPPHITIRDAKRSCIAPKTHEQQQQQQGAQHWPN